MIVAISQQTLATPQTLRRDARPTIHFPTCRPRLDAAPTELLAIFRGGAIKILLLRSMLPVLQNITTLSAGNVPLGAPAKVA